MIGETSARHHEVTNIDRYVSEDRSVPGAALTSELREFESQFDIGCENPGSNALGSRSYLVSVLPARRIVVLNSEIERPDELREMWA